MILEFRRVVGILNLLPWKWWNGMARTINNLNDIILPEILYLTNITLGTLSPYTLYTTYDKNTSNFIIFSWPVKSDLPE